MKIKYLASLSIFTLIVVGVVGCSQNEVTTKVSEPLPLPVAKAKLQSQHKKIQQQKSQLRRVQAQRPQSQYPKVITATEATRLKQVFDIKEGNVVKRVQQKPAKQVARVHRPQPRVAARATPRYQQPRVAARATPRYQQPRVAARAKPRYQAPRVAARAKPRYQPPKQVSRRVSYNKPAVRQTQNLRDIVLPPSLDAPRGNSNQPKSNRLTGDFADNQNTVAFISMMAQRHGFDRGYLNHLFSNTRATSFLKKMAYKDENPKRRVKSKARSGSWSRYRSLFLTPKTINKGIAFYRQNRSVFEEAERRYGVPKEYILGIIGVETRYGGNVGQNRAIDALATMGFRNARRGTYFQSELESFLLMSRRAGLNPLSPKASYAGAVGLCQFMPSNVKLYGVDMDRKGGCNLWTPADAIGSVANYFSKHGWKTGGDVAVRARTKGSDYKRYKHSYKKVYSLSKMKRAGLRPTGSIGNKVRLLRMSVYGGEEVWLADHNFYVITRYNHSSKYAMAVHQLAQAIKQRIGGADYVKL